MTRTTPASRPDHHEGRPSMGKNRRLLSLLAARRCRAGPRRRRDPAGLGRPGQRPPRHAAGRQGGQPDLRDRRCRRVRRADQQHRGRTTTRRPRRRRGCSRRTTRSTRSRRRPARTSPPSRAAPIARPNGANAGITAITLNQKSTVDTERVLHRLRALQPGQGRRGRPRQNLTFYAQSRDAVSYAVIGNAYAPTTPLTHDPAEGHLRVHDHATGARSAARRAPSTCTCRRPRPRRYTFFLQAIGSEPDQRPGRLRRAADGVRRPAERRPVASTVTRRASAVRRDQVGGPEQRALRASSTSAAAPTSDGQHRRRSPITTASARWRRPTRC